MKLDEKELAELRQLKKIADSDNIRIKEIIKKKLLENKKIIYVLNNTLLEDNGASIDEYFNSNIFPFYMIPETQTDVKNFICYEVGFDEVDRYNSSIKYLQIIFYVLCEQKGIIEETTGLARHDLLGHLLLDEFNYFDEFGTQTHCVSDKPSTVDSTYAARTLVFQMEMPNNLVQTKNGVTRYR